MPQASLSTAVADVDDHAGWDDTLPKAAAQDATEAVAQQDSWPDLEAALEATLAEEKADTPTRDDANEVSGERSPEQSPPQTSEDIAPPDPQDGAWAGFQSEARYEPSQELGTDEEAFDEDYEDSPPPTAIPTRRAIDEDLLAVLREEAAREVQARKAEGSALETQTELGLAAIAPALRTAVGGGGGRSADRPIDMSADAQSPQIEREARLSGLEQMPDPDAPRVTRRDLLPDIEEINSTLRATSDRGQRRDTNDPVLDRQSSSSFRRGFFGVITITLIALALYLGAPKLAQIIPAAAPSLARYVETVDRGRLWLDDTMLAITQSLRETPQP